MHIVPRIILGLFLLGLVAFSVFGFLASGELSSASALPWRIGYAVLGLCCLTGIGVLLIPRGKQH